jgi:hypothetical protein
MDHYHDDANVSANKPPAPEFVGEDGLAPSSMLLGLPPSGSSSVGESSTTSCSILLPRPPIPPLATERERLVERERQARLETERARRRQALLREQSLVDEMHQNNSLSLPMERFLERSSAAVTNEGGGGPQQTQQGSVVSANEEQTIIDNNNTNGTTALPYTMELFLAENAAVAVAVGPPRDDNDTSQMHHHDVTDGRMLLPNISPIIPLLSLTPDDSNFHVESTIMVPSLEDEHIIIHPTDAHILHHLPNNNSEDDGDLSAEISWGGSAASSLVFNNNNNNNGSMPTHHSIDIDIPPRLTEAGIAQLAEVDRASIGNAAPQSDRSEPSESDSIVNDDIRDETFDNDDDNQGGGPSFDRTFSVATQTTALESSIITDIASDGLHNDNEERYVNELDEIVNEQLNVFRVNSDISLHTHSSGGGGGGGDASSSSADASVVAMPSRASDDSTSDDDDDDNFIQQDTSFSSTDETSIAPRLTEADLVIQAEIDNASIGNAPPYSERGDELSESSVTERGGSHQHHHAIQQWKERVQSLESDVILLERKLLQKVDEVIVAQCRITDLETALCESEAKVQMLMAELEAKEIQSSKNNTQQKFT